MENEMIQWIVGQVGMGGIAALALVLLREAYRTQSADRETLIRTLQANTEALARLESAVNALSMTVTASQRNGHER